MPRIASLAAVLALGVSGGCTAVAPGAGLYVPMPDGGATVDSAAPEGRPYPGDNVGGHARSDGAPGQTFPDLSFEGIRSIDSIDTAEVVAMDEYFDPMGDRYDLLHIMGIFLWCPHCNNETKGLAAIAAWRRDHRVAVVQIAMEGYGRPSPGWNELQKWVRDHNCDFPVVVDGNGDQLGQYFPVDSVPLNIVVNPRTMEVMAVDIGEVGDVKAYEQQFLSLL